MKSDELILITFQQSNLKPLYDNFYAGLLSYASINLKKTDSFLAEDCVQNAIYKAWKYRNDFPTISALKSFLYTTIRNEIISIYRKQLSGSRYLAQLEDDHYFENSVIEQETFDIIYKAISELQEREKRVIELSFVEKLKIIEIAKILNLSESSIEKCKATALKKLKAKLSPLLYSILFVV